MRVSELLEYKTNECLQTYETLIDRGVCREQARMILPQNLYTEYYGTVNLNNLLKFIDLRTHEGAQWEIQRVAEACLDIATELWPITVNAYREQKGKIISGVAASPKTKEK
jgi:thymidylate synthase (FAD)